MGQPKHRGNTLLPLQGVKSPVILGYPGCRFACPGLSARWAFSPLCLITPLYLILHVKLDTLKILQFSNSWKYLWTLLVIHDNCHLCSTRTAKPLDNAQLTTKRELCQTCLDIAEVRRRKSFSLSWSCKGKSSFLYGVLNYYLRHEILHLAILQSCNMQ